MAVFTIHEAKTNLSELIAQAEAGEEVVIARGKEPAVRLVPTAWKPERRILGRLKGKASLPDSFVFDQMPEEELRWWEGLGEDQPEP
jgi:prevent-host-death family protein